MKPKSLSCQLFETIRDRIVHGEYPPGMTLPEKDLCEEFQVSRTPLREAFLRLQDMKLLSVIPRLGTTVRPIDIQEIRDAFEVKVRLEGLTGELAAERISPAHLQELDDVIREGALLLREGENDRHYRLIEIEGRFHEIVRRAARNAVLRELLDNLHFRCARLWSASLSEVVPDREIIHQMREVYTALQERNAEAARRHMEEHVHYFIEKIKEGLF